VTVWGSLVALAGLTAAYNFSLTGPVSGDFYFSLSEFGSTAFFWLDLLLVLALAFMVMLASKMIRLTFFPSIADILKEQQLKQTNNQVVDIELLQK
jgi:hypothetical protein